MELKFYGDLLSASCRAVALFMKMNNIPYVDMQTTAIRGICLQRSIKQWCRSDLSSLVYDCIMYVLSYITRDEHEV